MKTILFKIILKVIDWLTHEKSTQLKPEHLTSKGWVLENGYYVEPNIKGRDRIWIQFEHHYYRVYHGENRTFIDLKFQYEWLKLWLMLLNDGGCGLNTRRI
jgi:hypothetical protein